MLAPLSLLAVVISLVPDVRAAQEQFPFFAAPKTISADNIPPLTLHPIQISGPSSNRVDLIYFSDGYTEDEEDKFVQDARQLTENISINQTYNSVSPLLNFWAAFTPSIESGIGRGGVPKNTTFGLYREGTELRLVLSSYPDFNEAVCEAVGDKCDYPILLGNDPLYGGAGGRPTVITASPANGQLILRHELGHSVIRVGDEYDGGLYRGYFGVNAYKDLSQPVPWAHWLSEPQAESRVERAVMPLQQYTWTMLNATSSWKTSFVSSGTYASHVVRFSVSGVPDATDLLVELDGMDIGWEPADDIGLDRWIYDYFRDITLEGGEHELSFTLLNADRVGVAQLCSVEIMEYGSESEFNSTRGHYGLYPTFSDQNETAYRPTNEDCLMRIVNQPDFCSVCLEGLWHAFLGKLRLVDTISQPTCDQLKVSLVAIGQFRDEPLAKQEKYEILWSKDGEVVEEWKNSTVVPVESTGTYTVDVQYITEEIRVDPEGLTKDRAVFEVTQIC